MRKKNKIFLATGFSIVVICLLIFILQSQTQKRQELSKKEEQQKAEQMLQKRYSCEGKIAEALKKYESKEKESEVIKEPLLLEKRISLSFEGAANEEILGRILQILQKHQIKATFFIPAMEIAENEMIAKMVLEQGHDMQNYTLTGSSHMHEWEAEDVIAELCRSEMIYEKYYGYRPEVVKFHAVNLTEDLLYEAGSCGLAAVVDGNRYLNYTSFSDEETAKNYVEALPNGAMVSIKLNGYLDDTEYQRNTEAALDKEAGLDTEEKEPLLENNLLNVVEWVASAIENDGYETVYVKDIKEGELGDLSGQYTALREQNAGNTTDVTNYVYTTERKAVFTFRGISNEAEVDAVLAKLQEHGVQATFFVTAKELQEHKALVQRILANGCTVENGGYEGKYMKDADFNTICNEIYLAKLAFEKEGIETAYYMPTSSEISDIMKEAASALGVNLIGYQYNPIREEYIENAYSTEKMVTEYFGKNNRVICRGDIVYFNLNITQDEQLAAQLLDEVYQKKVLPTKYKDNVLKICTLSEIMQNTWEYPAATNETYYRIEKSKHAKKNMDELYANYYIGNRFDELSGFSGQQLMRIDTTGRVDTKGKNVVFLTFDDWGDEESIGKILEVLKKHQVSATFFVKTQYVSDSGRNLLRAMAEEGHDIASHTDTHMTVNITSGQVDKLQKDLIKSNQKLALVVGNTGQMTNYFRPPTLAINELGMRTIFDSGYLYIVSGDNSTGDYHAKSKEEMLDILIHGTKMEDGSRIPVQAGSIIVMHMSETAKYTAAALDDYLTYEEHLASSDSNKHSFAKLSDWLEK